MDEATRQTLGALYFALCEAAGGDKVLRRANEILADAVRVGAVDNPRARSTLRHLIQNS